MKEDLLKKSLHDLRVMAQAFGVENIFEKDAIHLAQEIEDKHILAAQELKQDPPPIPQYDARLMTAEPSSRGDMQEIIDLLEPYIKMGLKLSFSEESWEMHSGKKMDTGSIRMPLRHILNCARNVVS